MRIDLFGNPIIEEEEVETKVQKPSPFDYIKKISDKKYPDDLTGYIPYIINSSFSMRKDTIHYANEMDKYDNLSNREQHDFYFCGLPKRSYFAKWSKAEKDDFAPLVAEYFGCSKRVAKDYVRTLTKEQLEDIKLWESRKTGGR